jgi:aspartate/methionine/tyrosine aminotransferase
MAMPNPFYQVYASAALAAGAQPLYLDATSETGFLPDWEALDAATYARLRAVYLCSPANPQGAIADKAYLRRAYHLAKQHDFLLLVDECYSEIYDADAPPSILEIIAEEDAQEDAPVLVFHSLSKRSNLAGLRSGFVTGGADVMRRFHKLRMVAGPQTPLASQAAAALAWGDDAHVDENRAAYRAKLDVAAEIFGSDFGFYRPAGGFFLWLNVGDGERAASILWQEEGLRVLPGAYLATDNKDGTNIGAAYIRVALVAPLAETKDALTRLHKALSRHDFATNAAYKAAQ